MLFLVIGEASTIGDLVKNQSSFSETQAELANLPNFPAKFAKIKNPLKCINFFN